MNNGTILITGAAGFIGFHLSKKLLEQGAEVIGYDNLNDYYDPSLKRHRLDILSGLKSFKFIKGDLNDRQALEIMFQQYQPDVVVNLAAQAGVRYSVQNPQICVNSNLTGFVNILEACRNFKTAHLIFASSSSVYGNSEKVPFSEDDTVNKPVSLYAATKASNELMAYSYYHMFGIPCTGLRFFTVYGPLGRPDMAYYKFTQNIFDNEPIQIYNNGQLYRDFTYIDDIISSVQEVINKPKDGYQIYNIGSSNPENLMDFITVLENATQRKAIKQYLPMQPGDVFRTYADCSKFTRDYHYKPDTTIQQGLKEFVKWYRKYRFGS